MLFTARSIATMFHGMVLGGGALIGLAAALFALHVLAAGEPAGASQRQARVLSLALIGAAALLWLTVLGGTYIVFPPYRATPPEGLVDLGAYPRSLLLGSATTAWLHAFAMETKEHVPWIAAMLATAVAFISVRYRSELVSDRGVRGMVSVATSACLLLVSYVALLGVFVNKVAPLE